MTIEEILTSLDKKNEEICQNKQNKRPFAEITANMFRDIFMKTVKTQLSRKSNTAEFIIDEQNKEVLNQLYYWISKSQKFTGSYEKGILIIGNIGTGKTLIMSAFIDMCNLFTPQRIEKHHARKLFYKLTEEKEDIYANLPMFIDDLGKEPLEFVRYGYKQLPFVEFIDERYNSGSLTFATSNFKIDGFLKEYYGEAIADRLKEMFNIFELKGNSRR